MRRTLRDLQEGTFMRIGNLMETKRDAGRIHTIECPARPTLEFLGDK
jgi:hypothetical protein